MTTTWNHHRSSWVLAPKAPTHPHRNLHSRHQNRITGFYIWKRRTEKFSSIVEELRAGILEGAQGIKHPKHMENPKGPEHLLPQDFENPSLGYIALVKHKTHKSKVAQEWHTGQSHPCQAQCRAHPQLTGASSNLVHWPWAPQIHRYTWVRFTLESHRHVSMVAYSTACKNQQSAKEWIALWLIWSRQVHTVLQKRWTQEKNMLRFIVD